MSADSPSHRAPAGGPVREAPEQVQAVTAFIHIVEFAAIAQCPELTDFLPDILELFVGQPAAALCSESARV